MRFEENIRTRREVEDLGCEIENDIIRTWLGKRNQHRNYLALV